MLAEPVEVGDRCLAWVMRAGLDVEGVEFATPGHAPLQVGFMGHKAGHKITPHEHLPVERRVQGTAEVLLIRRGLLKVNFFAPGERISNESRILGAGDVILLVDGGHSFEVLEDLEMVEVKQGPYAGEQDKQRFEASVNVGA